MTDRLAILLGVVAVIGLASALEMYFNRGKSKHVSNWKPKPTRAEKAEGTLGTEEVDFAKFNKGILKVQQRTQFETHGTHPVDTHTAKTIVKDATKSKD